MVVELSATDVKIVSGLDTTPGTEEHNRSKTRVIINLQIYLNVTVQFPRIIFVKIGSYCSFIITCQFFQVFMLCTVF